MKILIPIIFATIFSISSYSQEHTIYYENFDANNGGWTSSTDLGFNGSWTYSTSATPLTAEGGYWHINSYNNYGSNYRTRLTNPSSISTTGFTNVTFYIDVRYDTDGDPQGDDGMQIQYTYDPLGLTGWTRLGNQGDGTNWYTDTDLDGIGNNQHGWSGLNYENSSSNSKFVQASISSSVLNNRAFLRFRVVFGSDNSSHDSGVAIDNVIIKGDYISAPADPTFGPAGVNTNLKLWLKANNGTSTTTNNTALTTWSDQAYDNDAVSYSTHSPLFKNNPTDNLNFNPVIDFERSSQDFMKGKGGYFSQDYFVVLKPTEPIDNTGTYRQQIIAGKYGDESFSVDGTGIGFGYISGRYTDAIIAHTIDSYPQSGPPNADSYGRCYSSSSTTVDEEVMILNIKTNSANTATEIYLNGVKIDNQTGVSGDGSTLNFNEFDNLIYYLGVGRFTLNGYNPAVNSYFEGRLAEIISYDTKNSLTDQQKIHSYLALKYGTTLLSASNTVGNTQGDLDYLDSNGNVIWDVSANAGYNYDIAGIGRDDVAELNQKQSKSVNTSSVVTIGHRDIATTNSNNTNNFDNDRDYLIWGHNNGALTGSSVLSVNLGASSTSVTTLFDRRWKIVESGNDVRDVKVSIPTSVLPAKAADEEYALVVSNTSSFGTNDIVDVIPMTVNGSTYETWYDFENTKYFTFGIASRVTGKYNVEFSSGDFLVGEDVVNLNSSFTVSSWVRNLGNGGDYVSKGNAYNFELTSTGSVRATINGTNYLESNTTITDSYWHHIAYTLSGGELRLYIDGVEDGNSPVTGVANPVATTDHFAIGVNYLDKNNITNSFDGDIDEVRIWDRTLTQNQIQYLMNQELENLSGTVDGLYLPQTVTLNEATSLPWNDMQAYHNINEFYGTTVVDGSGHKNWVRIKYLVTGKNIMDNQAAPLPYTSITNGTWNSNTTWTNGTEQYIPGSASIVDPTITVDWNIVETSHNITMDNTSLPAGNNQNRSVLALFVTANELELSGDTSTNAGNGLTVTHYLKIDGKMDLEGESQLIQTTDSDLDPTSFGSLERDQQGTRDLYTYNYWASPVGVINSTTNNNSYTLPSIFRDGSNPAAPTTINFITSGYNGTSGSPIGIADYWIWKYANQSGDYADWQHVRSTGSLLPGEGFTMKGVANTSGNVSLEQNYVYQGKPNNGDITLPITANNEYLVGNPYASAIDAHQFIMDNAPTIQGAGATTGTLYFWEHWGGGSHILAEYQGGYATYNLSGATPAASLGTNDPLVGTGGTPTKLPGRYIPVGQGFFVKSEATGTIRFNNSQRVFEKEGGASSIFMKSANTSQTTSVYNSDNRLKIRLGINTVNGIHRQLLVTQDTNASAGQDWGYDGETTEDQMDDMYWMIEGNKFIIQGTDVIDTNTVLPIGIHTDDAGNNTFTIDALENVPDNLDIYILDNATSTYHDIRANDFTINLPAGEYLDRFSMVFTTTSTLDVEDNILAEDINVYYNNSQESIVINNPKLHSIITVKLYNILSQEIFSQTDIETLDYTALKTGKLSTGTYIIKMKTDSGEISKKVLIE